MVQLATKYGHRVQISKARTLMGKSLGESIKLDDLAKECGLSRYYFIRLFSAYIGESPMQYMRRLRIHHSMELLEQDLSVTQIALEVGFDSSSSFNKAFKIFTLMSPTEFRNLSKDKRALIIKNISITKKMEEIMKNLNMSTEIEVITRPMTNYWALESKGEDFKDIAPDIWQKFLKVLEVEKQDVSQSEFMGVGFINEDKHCVYRAAVSEKEGHEMKFDGLVKCQLPETKYAKFLLKGSFDQIWPAVNKAFELVDQSQYEFTKEPCLENYLNDPAITPEEDLLTEILIPIK